MRQIWNRLELAQQIRMNDEKSVNTVRQYENRIKTNVAGETYILTLLTSDWFPVGEKRQLGILMWPFHMKIRTDLAGIKNTVDRLHWSLIIHNI